MLRTLIYMLLLIHFESCGYYAVSAFKGLDKDRWVYDGQGIAYVYILRDISQSATMAKTQYRSARDKMLSYMLKNNLPKELQMKVRMWFAYNWEHQKTLGEQLKTTIVFSIKGHAQLFGFVLDENSLLEALPQKMKADLAIHVHYDILSKVQLFQKEQFGLWIF
ncbi:hypothetical protein NP493_275g03039 [Ridgeia piscesae]|uniref:Chalcone isomerase domain-containing protein n=1 Tax=Ridgeia piscesae TaxID=27915 RepID=A0AAD9NXG0_RIDPI|nr:hypothetical protein NP493_275g03039 [Ridgeia piscesae]